ncbi:hypothetical protein C8N26_1157 [Tenacibaculum lutimaris]|uniref:J domain-containing protein n=1 Tax=Tenacibaculum lutimaris TaxID=285258 RepID=A0A420E305_9FLAO|nr:hypothetical protein [Tenacibaculum lutimaris]RKF04486.1 hypothetical protein C8N26_1157 [Tenacibaculum lutimaris]
MSKENFPTESKSDEVSRLQERIKNLETEIASVETKLFPFEQSLRNEISDLLVEERELVMLFKQQKKAKKEKRLAQKRKGKNYKEVIQVVPVSKERVTQEREHQKEKKRLYKEAMLYVHPDKFSMQENEQEKATETTTKLIEIYQNGSLEELEAFHAHIFGGNTAISFDKDISLIQKTTNSTSYLVKEVERLEKVLNDLLESYTYKVLTTYENPMSFVAELKTYYNDRIFKLRKRTRTKK